MDSFDDFEMKPITDGLGFHKKTVDLKESMESRPSSNLEAEIPSAPPKEFFEEEPNSAAEIRELMAELDRVSSRISENSIEAEKSLDDEIEMVPALPRESNKPSTVEAAPSIQPVAEITPVVPERPVAPEVPVVPPTPARKPEFEIDDKDFRDGREAKIKIDRIEDAPNVGVRRGAADSPSFRLVPAAFSISSAFLDVLVVFAMSLLFLVSLLVATGVNLETVFAGVQKDLMTQLSMGLLYVAVLQMYMVVARSFFGKTLGEWTFDYQMGRDEQINSAVYPLLVVWRSFIMVVTGVILLPVLSIISRRDVASYLTGLQLYRKQ